MTTGPGGSGGTGKPRDWDKELAEIDRLIAKQPAGETAPRETGKPVVAGAAPVAARGSAGPAPMLPPPARTRRQTWGTWGRVLLGAVLAAGVTQWPYAHRCGLGLFIYLGVVGTVVLAGLWGAVVSWRRRMGLAHALGLAVLLGGLAMASAVILPRTGYARQQLTWFCP